jgi:protocadherin-16/23
MCHFFVLRIHIREDSALGTTILKLPAAGSNGDDVEMRSNLEFSITSGNEEGIFRILSPSGEIVLVAPLDRETRDLYTLRVEVRSRAAPSANATTFVLVQLDDANDNSPEFSQPRYEIHVSEGAAVGRSVVRVAATDRDIGRNSRIVFDITSGNEEGLFVLDSSSGVLALARPLDRERTGQHRLVIRATDQATENPLSSLAAVIVHVDDENDNAPRFPVLRYSASVAENLPPGARVLRARATDLDRGNFGNLNYSIVAGDGRGRFRVDVNSGLVTTATVFDYEAVNRYSLTLRASDPGGLSATAIVTVDIESRDEFHPEFTERSYRFVAPPSPPVGYIVGRVHASDRDLGADGRVVYALASQDTHFRVNRTTGEVVVRRALSPEAAGSDVRLVVSASSGRPGSLSNMTVVEVALNAIATGGNSLAVAGAGGGASAAAAANTGGLADWALGLLIALILLVLGFGATFLFLHMRSKRQCKPSISTEPFDHSTFDTIDVRGPATSSSAVSSMAQFPPKYDEIPAYEAAAAVAAERRHHRHHGSHHANSELSEQSQSASSGRGSAEDGDDGEDEEIRMINEGPLMQSTSGSQSTSGGQTARGLALPGDSGCIQGDEDNLSDVSVHNTQQYLARLGIDTSRSAGDTSSKGAPSSVVAGGSQELLPPLGHSIHLFDDEAAGEADLANLFYAKLQHGPGSSGASATGDDQSAASTGGGGGGSDARSALLGFGGGVSGGDEGPSMTGSLSSIVHSEEELTGSYNWDYLLDWGPQYQPLAHVFSEIARLKDDTAPAGFGPPGKKAQLPLTPQVKTVPPPLLTSVAPRSIAPVARASHQLPRSPISHEAGFAAAMSPSFSPSLSPLATRSPSISPLVGPSLAPPHHGRALPPRPTGLVTGTPSGSEAELRI